MRFSELVHIVHREDDGGFDPVLTEDTPLYVDPFLVFEDEDPLFAGAQQQVVTFFSTCRDLVRQAGGNITSPHWKKALRLLTFPEPKEFALGLSMGSPNGAGTGGELAAMMADALEVMTRAVERGVSYLDVFAVFVPGLGVDRISDMFCNIMKARFIRYTQGICADRDIATEVVSVRNAAWQPSAGRWSDGRWSDGRVALPRSPVTRRLGQGVQGGDEGGDLIAVGDLGLGQHQPLAVVDDAHQLCLLPIAVAGAAQVLPSTASTCRRSLRGSDACAAVAPPALRSASDHRVNAASTAIGSTASRTRRIVAACGGRPQIPTAGLVRAAQSPIAA